MEPLENQKLSMHVVFQEHLLTDAAGLPKNAPKRIHVFNRVLDEGFFTWITNRTYSLNIIKYFSNIQFVCLRLRLQGAIYGPDSFVLMLRYCANLKAIR